MPATRKARGKQLGSESAVLVTGSVPRVHDSGSGFCVHVGGAAAFIVTCAHVVDDLNLVQGGLQVNGRPATLIDNAHDRGIDLAVLSVPGDSLKPVRLDTTTTVKPGTQCVGLGYVHLYGGQYVCTPLRGAVADHLVLRKHLSATAVPALLLEASAGTSFAPGNSGTAIYDSEGNVIAVLAYASQDGRRGYAISASVIPQLLPELAAVVDGSAPEAARIFERPPPPTLSPIKVSDDLHKGRFGGVANDGTVKLVPQLRALVGGSYFSVDLTVKPVGKGISLIGPCRFFLHDTFPRPMIQITKPASDGSFTLAEVRSYGAFTVGCQVFASDGRWHSLEYDLVDLPGLREPFKSR